MYSSNFKIGFCIFVIGLAGWVTASDRERGAVMYPIRINLTTENKTFSPNTNVSPNGNSSVLIVGGVPANPGEFPWIVNLRLDTNIFFCGGSLISLDTVLTAAHCLFDDKGKQLAANRITVVAGDHLLRTVESTEQHRSITWFNIHRQYDPNNITNDIAILKVSQNFNQTARVSPIPLATNSSSPGANGTAAGWGTTRYQGDISDGLRKVVVRIVTGSVCSRLMSNASGQFCAGEAGKDSCQGDSGGPFICASEPTRICGIVSYGDECGKPNSPGVYTKVSSYLSWIEANRYQKQASSASNFTSKFIFLSIFALIAFSGWFTSMS